MPRLRILGLLVVVAGCDRSDRAAPLIDVMAPPGFPAGAIVGAAPAENPLTEARAQLGKRLFFDPRLSRPGTVSCATCHQPERAFTDGAAVSTGVDGRVGRRNAPSLANLAWNQSFFWDGRARTLEEQVGQPIEDPSEMDLPLGQAVQRVADDAGYRRAFAEAYGGPPSETSLRGALASFVRTLVSGGSAYDRFLEGDEAALEPAARRGMEIFFGEKGGCFHCHPPGTLTNDGLFNNGTYVEGGDPGRQSLTGRAGDLGKFKVPGLRNIELTAPYMHDGSVATLEAVVDHYASGGRGGPNADPSIEPLSLAAPEKVDLVTFLRALTDRAFARDPRYRR